MSFITTGLCEPALSAAASQGYNEPTAIQLAAIPTILSGQDTIGVSHTGSGKTASYLLPILEKALTQAPSKHRQPTTLILVPTRELAQQVLTVTRDLTAQLPQAVTSLALYGGVSINTQMQELGKRPIEIIVATPGRLLDLVDKNALKLSAITTLVIDEADKMLTTGFKEEVDQVLSLLPKKRQNLLFSATLSNELSTILTANKQIALNNPVIISIPAASDQPEQVDTAESQLAAQETCSINEQAYFVTKERKGPLLRYLIKSSDYKQILVFASSAKTVDSIVNKLSKNKIDATQIHSQMSQGHRRQTLQDFTAGNLHVLVTTDLLARGIDIQSLPCVINYELPRSPKDYIHRIGRTGRAGSSGDALTLITMDELHHLRVIEKKSGHQITMQHSDHIDLHGY